MVNQAFINYERFLKIDPGGPTKEIVRARAVYGLGWGIISIQLFNLLGMTATYGRWTIDHSIATVAIAALLVAIHSLRYYKYFMAYAMFFTTLTITGVAFSALPDGTGVNSALLPFVVMMPLMIAFIAGPRLALFTGGLSIVFVLFLYNVSATSLDNNLIYYADRNQQRALQAIFCLILVSISGSIISTSVFNSFERLEHEAHRAQQAERAKSAFLAFMSHELRTPLNGILGLADALERTQLDKEQVALLKTINISGESLLSILNDILDLSKIESEKLEINSEPFNPKELTEELASVWRITAAQKDLHVFAEIDSDIPDFIFGDDLRVRQILSNFLSNAVKFTETGKIKINVETIKDQNEQSHIQFNVSDTGSGIAPDKLQSIFNPFEQADNNITRMHGGTGLGLTICQRLATLMKGKIFLQSTLGEGSVFSLCIPLRTEDKNHSVIEATSSLYTTDFSNLVALVIEDNLINQMVITNFLNTLGISYTVAANGQEGVDSLYSADYDFILMDKHMPVMDGVEAMKEIRRLENPISTIPIIACTADAGNGERENLLSEGFSEFLTKPIKIEALKKVIDAAMTRKEAA